MKKYNDDYFSVVDRRTGRKICDCGEWSDAMFMFDLDPHNRTITSNKSLMSPVIDVEIPKALPTNEIVVNMDGGVGGSWEVKELPQIKLPEGLGEPVVV
jgi:hypothetical protein